MRKTLLHESDASHKFCLVVPTGTPHSSHLMVEVDRVDVVRHSIFAATKGTHSAPWNYGGPSTFRFDNRAAQR